MVEKLAFFQISKGYRSYPLKNDFKKPLQGGIL